MKNHLIHLFLPHPENNHKPKILHLSSLTVLLFLIVGFQTSLSLIAKIKPGVLGFASNIPPQRLIDLTNQRRQENGLAALASNGQLADAARRKAAYMFLNSCWSHDCAGRSPWSFITEAGYSYLYAGENLAKDFSDPDSIMAAWMNSPSHRDNILNGKYREIGIAVSDGVLSGAETTLVVQYFGTPSGQTPAISYAAPKTDASPKPTVKATVKPKPSYIASPSPSEIASPSPSPSPEKLEIAAVLNNPTDLSGNSGFVNQPALSAFILTKTFSLAMLALLIVVLSLDGIIITHKQIVRISGKSFVHASFFLIIFISILLVYQGQIL